MKRKLLATAVTLTLIAVGCGASVELGDAANVTPEPTVQAQPTPDVTTVPDDTDVLEQVDLALWEPREALAQARATWHAQQPATYRLTYGLSCECDLGPWEVLVKPGPSSISRYFGEGPQVSTAPYLTVEALFGEIERAMSFPDLTVEVDYDPELAYPLRIRVNDEEIADGGYLLRVEEFVADPAEGAVSARQDLAVALQKWQQADLDDYDFTVSGTCRCSLDSVGPFQASVRGGFVSAATSDGVDVLELGIPDVDSYRDLVPTVEEIFNLVDRAQLADSVQVTYHHALGYPTSVSVDWDTLVADEEESYELSDVVAHIEICSTTGVDITLVPQPDLPEPVAKRRQRIFDAAMECDYIQLSRYTSSDFNASFGGGYALDIWPAAEARGEPVMLALVQHLNLAFADSGDGDERLYVWPSAFTELEASDGAGLDPADYDALLELYPSADLDEMFNGFGSYAGYRIGIDETGSWNFFVAGD